MSWGRGRCKGETEHWGSTLGLDFGHPSLLTPAALASRPLPSLPLMAPCSSADHIVARGPRVLYPLARLPLG